MSDTDQEHAERDPDLEIVDLEPLDPTQTIDKSKRDLSRHVAKHLQSWQFLRSAVHVAAQFITPLHEPHQLLHQRRKTRFAITSLVAIVGLVILLSVSGVFTTLIAEITPTPVNAVRNAVPNIPIIKSTIPAGQRDGLACIINAAWSPDSQRIAAFGYVHDCPQGHDAYEQGLLDVYNAHPARLALQLHPDAAVLSALRQRYTQTEAVLQIIYYNGIWSPDGQTIALFFNAGPPTNPSVWFSGVALITSNGNERVLLRQNQGADTGQSYLIWDLERGTATIVQYTRKSPNSSFFYPNISAAPSYHWGANGHLMPDMPVTTSGSSLSPSSFIGNPDNDGPMFSVWQPGLVQWVTLNGNGPAHLLGAYVWQSFFPAWSPDGRYLIDSLSVAGLLSVPGQKPLDHQDLTYLGVDQLGTLAVRDKALEQILHVLSSSVLSPLGVINANVAWRPDGRVLAAFDSNYVDIYNCATGRKLASLLPQSLTTTSGAVGLLSWSPNGSYLFLAGANWGPVQLWNTNHIGN